ncbi:MAG: 50S ribosomal protein L2 [Candidatus Aenigmarchaeota archaeon]|nr:50S ribosomal protein L2 [Candidatus Aenigmarchaeota archaeon]
MGKRTRSRVKGHSRRFRFPSHRSIGKPEYWEGTAKVMDIIHSPERTTPLALVREKNGNEKWIIPPEGVKTGQWVKADDGPIKQGNIFSLSDIPEGIPIFNIEGFPGDNGKFIRASGNFGFIVNKDANRCIVMLPSKKTRAFNPLCKAMIGTAAGGGRTDKPFVKASKKWFDMRSKGKLFPASSGSRMNAYDHPFGGKNRPGWPKTVKRTAPPGAKVGSIAARRTGKKR